MSTRDRVRLSVHEREQLAKLQASLEASDPELASVLRGQGPPSGPGREDERSAWLRRMGAVRGMGAGATVAARRAAQGVPHILARPWAALVVAATGLAMVLVTLLLAPGAGWPSSSIAVAGAVLLGTGTGLAIVALRQSRSARRRAR